MRQIVFPSLVFLSLLLQIFLPVLGQQQQQGQWGQVQPFRVQPSQFATFQNSQGGGSSGQQQLAQRMSGQTQQPKTGSLSNGPVVGGKLHLLSTLWNGLRNSGLERSIAGDVLERVVKISLRDLLVPFKRDVLFPLMS